MKNHTRKLFVTTLILFITTYSFSQTVSEIYNLKEITWFGLDFTKTKIVGEFGAPENTGAVIKDAHFKAWNNLMINEAEKYNLKKPFHKEKIEYKFEKAFAYNNEVNPDSIRVNANVIVRPLSLSTIKNIAAKYAEPSSKGVGVVFIVESFNKIEDIGSIDVVFFDKSTGAVLLSQNMKNTPGGFGVRNYWARTILIAIENVGRSWKGWIKTSNKK
jgi:hypothetical protein